MDNPTLERRLKAKDKLIAELLEALDALADAIKDSDVLLTHTIATAYTKAREAIRKAKGD